MAVLSLILQRNFHVETESDGWLLLLWPLWASVHWTVCVKDSRSWSTAQTGRGRSHNVFMLCLLGQFSADGFTVFQVRGKFCSLILFSVCIYWLFVTLKGNTCWNEETNWAQDWRRVPNCCFRSACQSKLRAGSHPVTDGTEINMELEAETTSLLMHLSTNPMIEKKSRVDKLI